MPRAFREPPLTNLSARESGFSEKGKGYLFLEIVAQRRPPSSAVPAGPRSRYGLRQRTVLGRVKSQGPSRTVKPGLPGPGGLAHAEEGIHGAGHYHQWQIVD